MALIFLICIFVPAAQTGCEDEFQPPPPATQPEPAEPPIDMRHAIHFKADRMVIIPNMVLVLQADSGGMAVSLTTSRTLADGTSLILGEFVRGAQPRTLVGMEFTMRGGRMYTSTGNLVRTLTAAYKPREATLKVAAVEGDVATGTIQGAFYRFAAPQSGITRPTEINVDATFSARLIIR